jgi:hypothetical protein
MCLLSVAGSIGLRQSGGGDPGETIGSRC